MEIYVKISFISIFSFFWFSNMILLDALILPVSHLQTQHVMTSQIRSHKIFNTDIILFCSFCIEICEKSSL